MSFSELGLAEPLLRAIAAQGYTTPTPIQQQGIPAVLSGRDLMAAAQTGTGKTAGFTLPMLHRLMEGKRPASNHIRALVLTPTRELAAQVGESVRDYGVNLPLTSAIVFGGVSINPQMMALRKGVDVLVATPGRLLDLYNQSAVKFSQVEMLVLDEADRMLDMGFIRDIRKILALLPKRRQNLLFSATFSDDITALAKGLLHNPQQVSVTPRNTAANTVTQSVYMIEKARKTALLSHLVRENQWEQVLVFTRTKHGANRLAEKLERDGVTAAAIHGNKSQGARTRALSDFKQNNIRVLVATDIAARGIDIDQLPHVVNFELPNVSEDYVHRIGRTGRAGASGEAISLVEPEEYKYLKNIEKLIKQTLPREEVPEISVVPVRPRTEAKPADAEADKTGKPQHRPKKRRTRSQKNEARKAAGLPPVKRNDGNAANKPRRRRRPSKPKAVA